MRSKKGKGNPNTEDPETTSFHLPWDIYSCSGDKISDPAGGLIASMTFSAASSRDPGVLPQPSPQPQQQWGQEETRNLIGIRGEMEKEEAMVAKGNGSNTRKETIWKAVSSRMRERGHFRTPEQCQYKWKNLVRRYKGKETSNSESGQPVPFFEELHSVITERVQKRPLLESEAGSARGRKKVKLVGGDGYSAAFSEGDCEIEDDSVEEKPVKSNSKKRKDEKPVTLKPSSMRSATDISSNDTGCINKLLKEFLQQQHKMEIEWMEMMEKSARERVLFEQEWRQSMEKLERERLMIEQAWREREEERRIREDNRAERRDALLTTLMNQLIHENSL